MLKTVKCQKFLSADRGIVQDHAMVSIFSDYYNTAARIIVLMEETCNMFIDMARKFLDPGSIFQIEVGGKQIHFYLFVSKSILNGFVHLSVETTNFALVEKNDN